MTSQELINVLNQIPTQGSISPTEIQQKIPTKSISEITDALNVLRTRGLIYLFRDDLVSLTSTGNDVVDSFKGGRLKSDYGNLSSISRMPPKDFIAFIRNTIIPKFVANHPEYSALLSSLSPETTLGGFIQPLQDFLTKENALDLYPGETPFTKEERLENSIEDYFALWLERLRLYGKSLEKQIPVIKPILELFTPKETFTNLINFFKENKEKFEENLNQHNFTPGHVLLPQEEKAILNEVINENNPFLQGYNPKVVFSVFSSLFHTTLKVPFIFLSNTPHNIMVNSLREMLAEDTSGPVGKLLNEFVSSMKKLSGERLGNNDYRSILSGVLSHNNFDGRNFDSFDFSDMTLEMSSFAGGANLSETLWNKSSVSSCNFTQANFTKATLNQITKFSNNIITQANFKDASFELSLFDGNEGIPLNVNSVSVKFSPSDLPNARMVEPVFSNSFAITPDDAEDARVVVRALQKILEGKTKVSFLLKFADDFDELRSWITTSNPPQVILNYLAMGKAGLNKLIAWLGGLSGKGILKEKGFSKDDINWLFNKSRELFATETPGEDKQKPPSAEEIARAKEESSQAKINNFVLQHENSDSIPTSALTDLIDNKEGLLFDWISNLKSPLQINKLWEVFNSLLSGLKGYHNNNFKPPLKSYTSFPYVSRIHNLHETRHTIYGDPKKQFGITLEPIPSLMPPDVYNAWMVALGGFEGRATTGPHFYGHNVGHGIIAPAVASTFDFKNKQVKTSKIWVVGEFQSDVYQKGSDILPEITQAKGDLNKFRRYFRDWPTNLLNAVIQNAGSMGVDQIWVPIHTALGGGGSKNWSRYYDEPAKLFGGVLTTIPSGFIPNPSSGIGGGKLNKQFYIIDLSAKNNNTTSSKLSWQIPDDFTSEETDSTGTLRRLNNKGQFHSLYSPAIEWSNGDKVWYLNGKLHRTDGPAVEYANGYNAWYQNGKFHREDGPAVERVDGTKFWYQNGKLHRIDGPAIEWSDGDKSWYLNGEYIGSSNGGFTDEAFENYKREHNIITSSKVSWRVYEDDFTSEKTDEDGTLRRRNNKGQLHSLYSPAVERVNGDKFWYQNGKRHREDGPAVEYSSGDKYWYQNGKRHRTDGPAVERADGYNAWYQNGKRHRTDGPAVEYPSGDKYWYQNGDFIGSSKTGFTDEDFENYKREPRITATLKFSEDKENYYGMYDLWKRQKERKEKKLRNIQKILPIIEHVSYFELPLYVKQYFESYFHDVFQEHPEAKTFVENIHIIFVPEFGPGGATHNAEYFKDTNVFELYSSYDNFWTHDYILYDIDQYLYEWGPEKIKKYFINKYLQRVLVHELTHSLQNYFIQNNLVHDKVAPYPQEEHPEYYLYGDFYQNDPGEIQARDVADNLKIPQGIDWETWKTSKLSWKIPDDFTSEETDEDGSIIRLNDKGEPHSLYSPAMEYANGDKIWYQNGERHRTDGPAIESADGDKLWYQNGKFHRTDGPAVEYANGDKEWYLNGDFIGGSEDGFTDENFENYKREHNIITSSKVSWRVYEDDFASEETDNSGIIRRRNDKGQLHSLYSPAEEYADGSKVWYQNGKLHRTDGPAIEFASGDKFWYQNDKLHRTDGPAIEYANGNKYWYQNGTLHRTDGPAIESADGDKSWYLNDAFIGGSENGFTDEDFENYKREHNITSRISSLKFGDLFNYNWREIQEKLSHHFAWVIEHNKKDPKFAEIEQYVTDDMVAQFAYTTFFPEYNIPQTAMGDPEFVKTIQSIIHDVMGYKIFPPPYIDWLHWMQKAWDDVRWFIKNQREISPDLGASIEELGRDWIKLWIQESVPSDIKAAIWYQDLFLGTIRQILKDKGIGDIFGTNFSLPQSEEEKMNLIINPVDTGEGGKDFVDPMGNPIETREEDDQGNVDLTNIFNKIDMKDYKKELSDRYLDALSEAMKEGNVEKIKNIKERLQELESLSHLKLSWRVYDEDFTSEETDEDDVLIRRNNKGQLHSLYSPAVEYADGSKAWYQNDKLHRTDGPAIELVNGDKFWYQNVLLHRTDGPAIEWSDGSKEWCQNGKRHRTDGPAIESANGDKFWFQNDKRHRTDGPAAEYANGDKYWYQNDKLHRTDGPAKEYVDGYKEWYLNGVPIERSENGFIDDDFTSENTDSRGTLRRRNDKGQLHSLYSPAVEYVDGNKYWYQNGERHRTDGPAIESADGDKLWYQNGKFHRTDGPAVEYANGDKEWYQNDKLHRTDGPAKEYVDGYKEWYLNGTRIGKSTNGFTDQDFENYKREHNITSSKLSWRVYGDDFTSEKTDADGTLARRNKKGQLHSLYSPAVELANGDKFWYQNGKRHREDGPAIESADGDKLWYQNGKFHRTDGPAVEYGSGDKDWYLHNNFVGSDLEGFTDADFENYKREHNITSSQVYFDGTPSMETVPEDLNFTKPLNDNKLRRVNPKRYDQKQDWFTNTNEFVHDSPGSNRSDFGTVLEASIPLKGGGKHQKAQENRLKFNKAGKLSWRIPDDFTSEKADEDGTLRRRNNKGQLHSLYSPAIEYADGSKVWYLNGKRHRTDGPAIERANGRKAWYLNDDFIGRSSDGFTDEDFENYKREHNIITSSKVTFAGTFLPGGEQYENYHSTFDINPGEIIENSPSGKIETNDPTHKRLDFNIEKLIFEKGLHQDINNINTNRSITPFGKLSWLIPDDFTSEKTDEYGLIRRLNNKGQLHSLYSPAEEWPTGNKFWYQNGERHRTDGPAEEWSNGDKAWYQNNNFHRTDGPAVERADGYNAWYQNGKRHRTDGPAVEYPSGDKYWYQNGDFIGSSKTGFTDEDFENYKREHNIIASSKVSWITNNYKEINK